MLVFTEVAENETVTIYTANVIIVKQAIGTDNSCSISLGNLTIGTYIATFNNTTFKFLKK